MLKKGQQGPHGKEELINLRRDNSNHTAPSESNTEKAEETHVQTIGSSLDLGKDLPIML